MKTVQQLGYKIPTDVWDLAEEHVQVMDGTECCCSALEVGEFTKDPLRIAGELHALLEDAKGTNMSVAIAATLSSQGGAIKALEMLGFTKTNSVKGREGRLYFWTKPLNGSGSALPKATKKDYKEFPKLPTQHRIFW